MVPVIMIDIQFKSPSPYIRLSPCYVIDSIRFPLSSSDRDRILNGAEARGETHLQWEVRFLQAKRWRTIPGYEKKVKRETKLYKEEGLLFADVDDVEAKQITKLSFFLIILRNIWLQPIFPYVWGIFFSTKRMSCQIFSA